VAANAVIETYQFENDQQQERYRHFVDVLRCPKCQNQNLTGSNSPIARDLRRELHRMLLEGKSDEEIVEFMVARYGDYVLYDPPVQKNTYALWYGPMVLGLVCLVIIVFVVKRFSGQSSPIVLSEADTKRLENILSSDERQDLSGVHEVELDKKKLH
jgi:cytochrome c-type biogenesis protein CcmH